MGVGATHVRSTEIAARSGLQQKTVLIDKRVSLRDYSIVIRRSNEYQIELVFTVRVRGRLLPKAQIHYNYIGNFLCLLSKVSGQRSAVAPHLQIRTGGRKAGRLFTMYSRCSGLPSCCPILTDRSANQRRRKPSCGHRRFGGRCP